MKGKGKLKILSGKLRCKNVSKNFSNKKCDYKCPNVKEHRNSICRYSIPEKRRIINRRKAVIIGKMEDNILELKEDLSLQFKGFH